MGGDELEPHWGYIFVTLVASDAAVHCHVTWGLFIEISVAWQHNRELLGRRLQAWHEYTSHFSQQTCCKSLICAFCWALFSFPLSISDLSLLIVSKRVSCFSVIICLLCEDKNFIQKAAPTTPRHWKLKLSVISSIVSLRNRTPNAWLWKTWRGYYLRVLSGIHLTLMFFALLQKDLFEGMWSFARRRKGGFAWITPSLWSPRTQAYGLVNLVFSLQTGFSSAHIRLLMNRWSKTEPAVPSRRLLGSAGRVGSLLVCTWCHGGHVDGQEQKHFSPLGTKL